MSQSGTLERPGAGERAERIVGGLRLSRAEQKRRAQLLQELLQEHALDALVLAGNDYRGHKGTLRWVADYNLAHRHGFAFVAPGREPELVLPQNLAQGVAAHGWSTPVRYARRAAKGLLEAIAELPSQARVGIVGMNEIMRVADADLLRQGLPDSELLDVTEAFERVRAQKSLEELAGVRESTYIAERCFERLLEVARPGMTQREIGAEMYRLTYMLGGEDPLFLCMSGERMADGGFAARWAAPRDHVMQVGEQLVFSFELIGPLGYWMEFARAVVFGTPTDDQVRLNKAAAEGMDAAACQMRPGQAPGDVQAALLEVVESHGATSAYWSGHGLGQDVIEEPWIGREVVDTEAVSAGWQLAERMVLAMHPLVTDRIDGQMAYLANSYIVTPGGGRPVSEKTLDIYVL